MIKSQDFVILFFFFFHIYWGAGVLGLLGLNLRPEGLWGALLVSCVQGCGHLS